MAVSIPGIGVSITPATVGNLISGGTANDVLFVGSGGVLSQSSDFTYNDTTKILTLTGGISLATIAMTGNLTMANATYLFMKDSGGTARPLLNLDASNDLYFGHSSITGKIYVANPFFTTASVAGTAGFRLPHGTAPSSPVNGDMWTTTAGLYVRINGATIGPLS